MMRKLFIVALLAGTAGMVALAASMALISLGGVSAQPAPGGTLEVGAPPGAPAEFMDKKTGTTYVFRLIANEDTVTAGVGDVTLLLEGNPRACSARGPDPFIDFGAGGPDFGGNTPLPDIECGTAFVMAVAVDGCIADIELHGFVHSDHPNVTYMGMMTLDLRFHKGVGGDAGIIDVTIHTPKGITELHGSVMGTVVMDTCP